ncbi:hypothetical protein C9374_013007 [Naegleria lovaniensis]|uniref:Uncharacterized protein n=1 Tax=Naegleria lovaniensis TaxID=51637 RepID=A0AA88G739_NAELO|nr:uncharacterized protein C9374_013007 [Naegleria lovaniensis]KAG2372977.1 hypothetical protein C9374_013007 [Naegleria lovaniensis]
MDEATTLSPSSSGTSSEEAPVVTSTTTTSSSEIVFTTTSIGRGKFSKTVKLELVNGLIGTLRVTGCGYFCPTCRVENAKPKLSHVTLVRDVPRSYVLSFEFDLSTLENSEKPVKYISQTTEKGGDKTTYKKLQNGVCTIEIPENVNAVFKFNMHSSKMGKGLLRAPDTKVETDFILWVPTISKGLYTKERTLGEKMLAGFDFEERRECPFIRVTRTINHKTDKLITFLSNKMFFKKDRKTYTSFAKLLISTHGLMSFKVEAYLYKDDNEPNENMNGSSSSNTNNGEYPLKLDNIETLFPVNNKCTLRKEKLYEISSKFTNYFTSKPIYLPSPQDIPESYHPKKRLKEEARKLANSMEDNADEQNSKKKQKLTPNSSNVGHLDESISSTLFIAIEDDINNNAAPTEICPHKPFIQSEIQNLENAHVSKLDLLKMAVQEWLSRPSNDEEANKGLSLMKNTSTRKLVQSVIYRNIDSNIYQVLDVIYEASKMMNVNHDACLDKAFKHLESQFLHTTTEQLPQHEERKYQFCNLLNSKLPIVKEFESIIELIQGCSAFFSATQPLSISTFHELQRYALTLYPQEANDIHSYFTLHVFPSLQLQTERNNHDSHADDPVYPYVEKGMSQHEMQKRVMDLLMKFKEPTMGQTFMKKYVNQIQSLNLEDGLSELYQQTIQEYPHWEDEVKEAYEKCLQILEEQLLNQCFDSQRRSSFGFSFKQEFRK